MASIASQLRNRKWTRDSHLISTDISLISIKDLNDAFASEEFYWGKPLPEPVAKETLQNSLCFALYDLKTTPLETAEDLLRQKASGTTVDDDLTPKFIG
nr:putative GNAT family N-acetyltransferase [Colletotrichum truncatum]KAF6780947.1 putative GNAT family N-acetyltransferase [Colletotrichum truncatum]